MSQGGIYAIHSVSAILAVVSVFTAIIHEEGEILRNGVRYCLWIFGACLIMMGLSFLLS